MAGLCAGLLVSTFSKSLALLIGLGVVAIQVRPLLEGSGSYSLTPNRWHPVMVLM
jgi:hypothetical protein